jgi:hypothetical protein
MNKLPKKNSIKEVIFRSPVSQSQMSPTLKLNDRHVSRRPAESMKHSGTITIAIVCQVLLLGLAIAYVENIHDLEDLKDTELLQIFNNPYGDSAKIPGEDRPGMTLKLKNV